MTIIYSIGSTETKIRIKVLLEFNELFKEFVSCSKPCDSNITSEESKTPMTKRAKAHLTYYIYLSRLLSQMVLVPSF